MRHSVSGQQTRPVLKWAGGKGQLLPELVRLIPADFGSYHEPFVGGGALFFELSNNARLQASYLSDINPSVIDVYLALRDCVDEVIELLKEHRDRHGKLHYYRIRAQQLERLTLPERAARVLYLNKTCYNGLYRENRAGQFNVPVGRYENPTICDEPNLRAVSQVLQNTHISCRHFASVLEIAHPGDLVYFDPPYHPISSTARFTSYDRNGFGEEDQVHLRDVFFDLTGRGVKVILSNSDTSFVRELYAGYAITRVFSSRAVNSKADARGKVAEVIVRNYTDSEIVQRALLEKRTPYTARSDG